MHGQTQLEDETILAASQGMQPAIDTVAGVLNEQVRLMVMARLSSNPSRFDCVEEIGQSAVVDILKGLPRLKNSTVAGFKSFSSTIVSRRVADFLRDPAGIGRGRAAPGSLDTQIGLHSQAGPLWQFLSATQTSPLSAAARSDQVNLALIELGKLQESHREVITFAFFDQLSTAQIAAILGVTRPAASMLLIRALKTLRRNLTGHSRIESMDYDD